MRVVFIASSGRSGSTILDRLLGSTPGAWSGGELDRIWEVADDAERLCACGQTTRRCEFWSAVFRETFGPVEALMPARADGYYQRFRRAASFAMLLSPLQPPEFQRDLREYRDILRRFYDALVKISDCQTIIDSSKSISYAWILGGLPNVGLNTVQLVRDSRAVAYSWTRSRASSIDIETEWRPVQGSAFGWIGGHTLAELLRPRSRRFLRLRYEDFARNPAASLSAISRRFGLPPIPLSETNSATLADTHIVTGNPLRFQTGEVVIREDDEWKRSISTSDATLVTAITWPMLLRHGYKLRFR